MNHLYSLFNFLKSRNHYLEASLVRLASQYNKIYKKKVEELAKLNPKPFESWFGGKYRLYFPLNIESEPTKNEIDKEVEMALSSYGYKITDYVGGYCEKDGVKYRIGKIISKLKEQEIRESVNKVDEEEVLKRWAEVNTIFLNSSARQIKNIDRNLLVVISQNPHDIAKMSFERRWTSCMKLTEKEDDDKEDNSNIYCEVSEGGLVAYLINKDDKSIENPLARISIRRFVNDEGISIALPEADVYGMNLPGFYEIVKEWTDEKNKINMRTPINTYSMRGRGGSDTFTDSELFIRNFNNASFEELKDAFNYLTKVKVYVISISNFSEFRPLFEDALRKTKSQSDKEFIKNIINSYGDFLTLNYEETINRIKKLKILDYFISSMEGEVDFDQKFNSYFKIFNINDDDNYKLNKNILNIVTLLIEKHLDEIDSNFAKDILDFIIPEYKRDLGLSATEISLNLPDALLDLIKKFPKYLDLDIFMSLSPEQKVDLEKYFGDDLQPEIDEYHSLIRQKLRKLNLKSISNSEVSKFIFEKSVDTIFSGPYDQNNFDMLFNLVKLYINDDEAYKSMNNYLNLLKIKNNKIKITILKELLNKVKTKWRFLVDQDTNIYHIFNFILKNLKEQQGDAQYIKEIEALIRELYNNAETDISSNKEFYVDEIEHFKSEALPEDIINRGMVELERKKNTEVIYRKGYLKKALTYVLSLQS
jgi:hypothetical protein